MDPLNAREQQARTQLIVSAGCAAQVLVLILLLVAALVAKELILG